uniref:Hyperglycemic hormone n=1 Tax=Steinernema glaseri TaxID=37863 RepID=A0A1I7ZKZ8_9BILA
MARLSSSTGLAPIAVFALAFCAIASLSSAADSRMIMNALSNKYDTEDCPIYRNSPLHVVMDRVCLMCHEMYSHERPNMRVECRSNCFRTEHFRKCLQIFMPADHPLNELA